MVFCFWNAVRELLPSAQELATFDIFAVNAVFVFCERHRDIEALLRKEAQFGYLNF